MEMEMCRVCLSTENGMIPFDESFINDYNLLTSLNIVQCDGMPQYSCQNCMQTVKFYIDFREKCINSESTLQQVWIEKIKSESKKLMELQTVSVLGIKQEVKEEKAEDNLFECCFDDAFADFDEDLDLIVKNEDLKPKNTKGTKRKKISLTKTIEELVNNSREEYPCGICVKTFKDKQKLNDHLDNHRNGSQCEICWETFKNWPALLAHRITHLNGSNNFHHCHICSKRGRSALYLEHHYMNMHYEGEKSKLTCKHCSRTYKTPRQLMKHMWSSHSKNRYICDYCSKAVNNKQKLLSHIKSHSDVKNYVCDLCGFSCRYSGGLKDHKIRKHSLTKVTCKKCQRVFLTQEECNKHSCKVLARVCPVCGINITRSKRFDRHLESHREVGRHKCDRCPAAYKSRSGLAVHINRHDGVRTKQCEYCPLKFYSASVLVKHRRTHTGEKPYVCKVCFKGFTGNYNLKVHMKVHGEHLVVKKNKEPEELTSVFK